MIYEPDTNIFAPALLTRSIVLSVTPQSTSMSISGDIFFYIDILFSISGKKELP